MNCKISAGARTSAILRGLVSSLKLPFVDCGLPSVPITAAAAAAAGLPFAGTFSVILVVTGIHVECEPLSIAGGIFL